MNTENAVNIVKTLELDTVAKTWLLPNNLENEWVLINDWRYLELTLVLTGLVQPQVREWHIIADEASQYCRADAGGLLNPPSYKKESSNNGRAKVWIKLVGYPDIEDRLISKDVQSLQKDLIELQYSMAEQETKRIHQRLIQKRI